MSLCDSLNLKIVQKLDGSARDILFTGRHVVLYIYDNESWVSRALLLTRRSN